MITIEKYSNKHKKSFIEFIVEFQTYGDEFGMMEVFNTIMDNIGIHKKYNELSKEELNEIYPKYLDFTQKAEKYKTLTKKDWVETDYFAICKDGEMIGEMVFRKRLNKYLLTKSLGHISYKIKHTERGKKYGKQALNRMLNKIWNEYNHTEIMICCKENNIASSKLIESCGGVFNRLNKEKDDELGEKEYWFFKQY